jgi:hypothetical protein
VTGVWKIVFDPRVVRRALGFAVVVGSVLVAINHGDAIVGGTLSSGQVVKIGLTVVVPYVVSTWSSVLAVRGDSGPGPSAQ